MSLLPDWLTGYDSANADAAAAADAQLQASNASLYGVGGKYYTPSNWDAVQTDYATQAPIGVAAQSAAIDQAFTDSLDQSARSIVGGPLGVIGDMIKSIFKAFPWWVWLVLAAVAFAWLGGFTLLRGSLAKGKKA